MSPDEIRQLAATRLPSRYDDLRLTFYGIDSQLQGDHVVIGDDYWTKLHVRLGDGCIYSVDPKHKLETSFVNSGIEQLARFIEVSRSFAGTKLDTQSLSREMRDALGAVDSRAFTENPNWWGEVLEGSGL